MLLLLALWIARRVLRNLNGSSVVISVPHSSHTQCRWAALMIGILAIVGGGTELLANEREINDDELAVLPVPTMQLAELGRDRADSPVMPHLREGTLVTETVGRIVMMGRRWAFVRANEHNPPDADVALRPTRLPSLDGKPRPTRLGMSTRPAKARVSIVAIAMRDRSSRESSADVPARHMLITENLMLQRIVEAIRADGSDNVWSVTGEVTEFFNENRLIIRTAQRAGSR